MVTFGEETNREKQMNKNDIVLTCIDMCQYIFYLYTLRLLLTINYSGEWQPFPYWVP